MFDLVPRYISGIINLSLSVTMAQAMSKLRSELRSLLRQRLRIYRGQPVADAERWRSQMLNTFLKDVAEADLPHGASQADLDLRRSTRKHQAQRRKFLKVSTLLNGDWRCSDEVQHYLIPGGFQTRAQVLRQLYKHVVPALAGEVFPMFPRNRWLNSLESIDKVGFLFGLPRFACGRLPSRFCTQC